MASASPVLQLLVHSSAVQPWPEGMWRRQAEDTGGAVAEDRSRLNRPPQSGERPDFFCLHSTTVPSLAGVLCVDCGVVTAAVIGDAGPGYHGRGHRPVPRPLAPTTAATQTPSREWELHVRRVDGVSSRLVERRGSTNQPPEVVHNAKEIFIRVCQTRGAVTGDKARALVLVSLLYSSRLLHGANPRNEDRAADPWRQPT